MKRVNFLATDYTAAINATATDGTEFTSIQLDTSRATTIALTFYVDGGHASCAQNITFKLVSYDSKRATWDTIDCINDGTGIQVAMNGTTAVQKTILVSSGFEKLKLLSIANPETTATYTASCNVSLWAPEWV